MRNNWKDKVVLQIHPYLNAEYFGFLVDTTNELIKNSPTRLKKLRQAMNYAIDRRKMILYLRNSLSSPAESGFVPEGMPSFDTSVKGYKYDPAKAKQLLEEAGLRMGQNHQQLNFIQFRSMERSEVTWQNNLKKQAFL